MELINFNKIDSGAEVPRRPIMALALLKKFFFEMLQSHLKE